MSSIPPAAPSAAAPKPALPQLAPNHPAEGALWMLASGLVFAAMNVVMRHLGTDLPTVQSAFLRYVFGVVLVLPALIRVVRAGLPPGSTGLFAARGAVHSLAVVLWFYAMARLPVAEVTAIGYLNPVLVTIGAALFLGERLALRRILAICVAMLGAVIILRPGLRPLEPAHLAQLSAAACFATSYLLTKRLSRIASPTTIVAILSLAVTIVLLVPALMVWQPVTPVQLAWLALVAALATSGHYFMTRAFGAAPMAVTQPVTFLQLLWATILGVLVFGEPVDPWVILGGGVIMAAISYITWREAVLKRRAAAQALTQAQAPTQALTPNPVATQA